MESLALAIKRQPAFQWVPTKEMESFFQSGLSLVPLGGEDGKSPLVKFQGRQRLPLHIVREKMQSACSSVYGVRLKELTVVDIDKDDRANRGYPIY